MISAPLGRIGADFDQDQLPADVFFAGDVVDFDHFDQFVQLFGHLFDDMVIAFDHQGDPGNLRILRRPHSQTVNIIATAA